MFQSSHLSTIFPSSPTKKSPNTTPNNTHTHNGRVRYTPPTKEKTQHRDPTITQRELYTDERLRCRKHLMPQILGNFAPNHSEQTSWPRRFGVAWEIYPCCNHLSLEHALWCSLSLATIGSFSLGVVAVSGKKLITSRQKPSPNVKTSRTWQKKQRVFWGHLIKPVISFIHEVYWIGES